jgi:hypothetical protein
MHKYSLLFNEINRELNVNYKNWKLNIYECQKILKFNIELISLSISKKKYFYHNI